ncbi:hypothetical protein NPIL_245791 [Nephila pilipes]|uniref:Uncharacterized protein n=1 Tax=Nephila pilipes TaxID=299642 RepID=A0A8X6ME65_NEPPI|nr:hypothetical protein NPIL_245791 [Nephila pilipes]
MKSLCVLALVFCCVYVVVAKVGDRCITKDDCDEDECCVSGIFSIPTGKCKKLKIKDDWCAPKVGERDRYFHMCPCGEGLSCEAEETEVLEGGVTFYRNAKCVEKEETTIAYGTTE